MHYFNEKIESGRGLLIMKKLDY